MSIGYSFAVVRKRPIPSGTAGLPERLREAREAMYLSQSKLSLLAGLGRITVHNIEERRTQGNVGIVTVEKLAKVLRVSPCWLAYGVGVAEKIAPIDSDDTPGAFARGQEH
ncbi:MAG: helix-turn-helix transcriptional regulator [Myxococcales bacterium]|nr:helix-turn-helix transcriptional regulator [Myxococcales bacterium]